MAPLKVKLWGVSGAAACSSTVDPELTRAPETPPHRLRAAPAPGILRSATTPRPRHRALNFFCAVLLVLNPKGEDVLCHHHKDIAHQVLGGLRVSGSQGLSDLVVTE